MTKEQSRVLNAAKAFERNPNTMTQYGLMKAVQNLREAETPVEIKITFMQYVSDKYTDPLMDLLKTLYPSAQSTYVCEVGGDDCPQEDDLDLMPLWWINVRTKSPGNGAQVHHIVDQIIRKSVIISRH